MELKITMTKDGYDDGTALTQELDGLTLKASMSLSDYADYLEGMHAALEERLEQVREEAGCGIE